MLDVAIYKCIQSRQDGTGGDCYRKSTDHHCLPSDTCFDGLLAMPIDDFKRLIEQYDKGWSLQCSDQ